VRPLLSPVHLPPMLAGTGGASAGSLRGLENAGSHDPAGQAGPIRECVAAVGRAASRPAAVSADPRPHRKGDRVVTARFRLSRPGRVAAPAAVALLLAVLACPRASSAGFPLKGFWNKFACAPGETET